MLELHERLVLLVGVSLVGVRLQPVLRLDLGARLSGDGWQAMGPDQPRFCSICNKRIVLGRGSIEFKTSPPQRSTHIACKEKTSGRIDGIRPEV
ncbi:MAG TPA: hypothetical protein VNH80_04935 [Burkholderiales bacterium]|nr:hypothetical protein [Burkholderiales bacterium]